MSELADNAVYRFGHELNAWCHRSGRVRQTSTLYDLPGRSSLGFSVLHDLLPELLASLEQATTPEELGRRMRAPLMRPYCVQLHVIMESWLMARERAVIDSGDGPPDGHDPERDRRDWRDVGEWYARVGAAARADGQLYATSPEVYERDGSLRVGETVASQPLLDESQLSAFGADADPLAGADLTRVQRAFGALELYAMTLHGEQRDGLNDHGPYPRADGCSVVFHEVNDLCNDVLPWSIEETRLPIDAVGAVRAYSKDVELEIDMWGTLLTRPLSQPQEVRALWAREGESVRALGLAELEQLAARAVEAMTGLYRRMADWDEDYRIAYGAPLFVNQVVPFLRLAGVPSIEAWLWSRAEAVVQRELPRLRGAGAHPVWARLARTDTDVVFTAPERLA